MYKIKTIAISGSSGFVGSYLKKILDKEEYKITSIDLTDGIDLSDWNSVKNICDFDVFVHLANLVYVPDSFKRPIDFYRINYLTTLNALELCRKNNAKFIYISSYIYGSPQYLPIDENHALSPFNPYAETKFICENLCQGYFRDFGVISLILRPFNIYGANQKGDLLIPSIIKQIKEGCKTVNLKNSRPKRDYVYVSDVADAIKSCIDTDFDKMNTFNVCSGKSFSVLEITQIINKYLENKVEFIFDKSDRKIEVMDTRGTYKKLEEQTGWNPKYDFESGIKKIISEEL